MGTLEGRAGAAAMTAGSVNKASPCTAGWTDPWRATWQAGQSGVGAGAVCDVVSEALALAASLKKRAPSTWWCSSRTRKMCNCTTTASQAVRSRTGLSRRNMEAFLDLL
jgi:hypothetical protein